MIDWVSLVQHSRRRFSNYMYGVPGKVRKKRQRFVKHEHVIDGVSRGSNYNCCWAEDKVHKQKARYQEEDMPPPPSPPHPTMAAVANIDNVSSRQGSLERVASGQRKRRESIEQTAVKEQQHPEVSYFFKPLFRMR
nr:unnamed protein product [Callosobruchus analis]